MNAFFMAGESPAAVAKVNSMAKRSVDRDLRLKTFKSEALRVLDIKEHAGGGRPPEGNKRKLANLHEAISKYKADLELLSIILHC